MLMHTRAWHPTPGTWNSELTLYLLGKRVTCSVLRKMLNGRNSLACGQFSHLYNNVLEVRVGLRPPEVTGSESCHQPKVGWNCAVV
jgi:hypothetical protein